LNVSLGEFVEHYRTAKGKRITPATLSTYLDGIYRWIQTHWDSNLNILTHKTFTDTQTGYIQVTNNVAAKMQAQGILMRLRTWLITKLKDSGFNDSEITLRTGHNSIQSLQSYMNIHGKAGKYQQECLFPPAVPENSSDNDKEPSASDNQTDGIINGLRNIVDSINNNTGNITFNVNIHKHN